MSRSLISLTSVNKPWSVYYPDPIFLNIILAWDVRPGHHLCSHSTNPSLTPSYECLTPASLFGFQNLVAKIFKLSHFHIVSILITYCIILSKIITSQTFIPSSRSTSLDLFVILILSSSTLFWHEMLNLVATCAYVWPLWGTTLTFKVLS